MKSLRSDGRCEYELLNLTGRKGGVTGSLQSVIDLDSRTVAKVSRNAWSRCVLVRRALAQRENRMASFGKECFPSRLAVIPTETMLLWTKLDLASQRKLTAFSTATLQSLEMWISSVFKAIPVCEGHASLRNPVYVQVESFYKIGAKAKDCRFTCHEILSISLDTLPIVGATTNNALAYVPTLLQEKCEDSGKRTHFLCLETRFTHFFVVRLGWPRSPWRCWDLRVDP